MPRLLRSLVVVVMVLVSGCWVLFHGNVSSAEAHLLVEKGALLLDVRSCQEAGRCGSRAGRA